MSGDWNLSNEYLETEVDEYIVFVPTSAEKIVEGDFFAITGVGRTIWKMLKDGATLYQIKKKILNAYDVDENVAQSDIEEFYKTLQDKGIIV